MQSVVREDTGWGNKLSSHSAKAVALKDVQGMGRRLLLLSRNQTIGAELIAPAFRSRGWEVFISAPTSEDIKEVDKRIHDLVIMEITRPGPEGYALCEELRRRSRIPLLLIVSAVAKKDIVEGLNRGADAYVLEPFDLRELLVRAEALVRRAKGQNHG